MGDKHDLSYYIKCMIGGAFGCGLTHTAIVTLDIIKCRKQIDPTIYKSVAEGFNKIKATEGTAGLVTGWVPTLIGYSLQGCGKFGFYELFKDIYAGIVGPENAYKYRTLGYSISSACAELIADAFLCPFEALKVRMQTSKPGTFPTNFGVAFNKLKTEEGTNGFYKGIAPLWARQVPYTIVKFVFFEKTVEAFYRHVFTKPKNEYSKPTQLSVTFASGYIAGVLCAIVSHPADTMVSKLNNVKTEGGTLAAVQQIYGQIGFAGLWRGLGTRIIMIGTLTGLQWWIYDTFKTLVGLQTTGGVVKK
jgi:solute carrier family 25 phosphate transporter 3